MDKIIGVLLGVLLGAFLGSLGYFYKIRCKKLMIIHQNIFYLLKIFNALYVLINSQNILNLYTEKFQNDPVIKKNVGNNNKVLDQMCNKLSLSYISSLIKDVNQKSKDKFNDALHELSGIKPVLANRLSAASYFQVFIDRLNNPIETITSEQIEIQKHLGNQEFIDGFDDGLSVSRQRLYSKLEKKLLKDIKTLLLSSSIQTFFSCHYEIYKIKKQHSKERIEADINEYFEKEVLPMMEKYKT